MMELSFEQILALTAIAQVPTWTVLGFLVKRMNETCERIAREEVKSDIYHPNGKEPVK